MHPIVFTIGGVFIGSYGVMIVLGVFSALWLSLRLGKRVNVPGDFLYDLVFICLAAGFVGARLLYILLNWSEFLRNPVPMIATRSGFVFLGGFILATGCTFGFIRFKAMPKWVVCDIVSPGVALAHAFGRIGCFFAGCCYGAVCPENAFYGVRFPKVEGAKHEILFSFAYRDHLAQGLIAPEATASLPVLPTQLLESAVNLAICGALLWLWGRRKFEGSIFSAYLMMYGVARFSMEFVRGDTDRGFLPLAYGYVISTSQIISLGAVLAGAALWAILGTREPARAKAPREARPKRGK